MIEVEINQSLNVICHDEDWFEVSQKVDALLRFQEPFLTLRSCGTRIVVNDQKFVLVDLVCRVLWSVTRTAGSFQNWFDPSDDQKSKTSFKIPRSFLNISPHERFNEHLLRWITQLSQTHPLFHGLLRFYWALLRRYQWFGFHTSGKIMKLGLSRQNQKERRTPVGSEMICY